ncbi:MAG: SRPBCC family protein [Simkaniaceae bacterium]
MFRWNHQYSVEVDTPLHVAWNFFTDPSHWPLYDDRMEAFIFDGDFKSGAQVKLKLKNKPNHIGILLTEVKPHREYRTLIHSLLAKEEKLTSFEVLAPNKTRVTFQICVLSCLVPFIKSKLLKNIEEAQAKSAQALFRYIRQFS